MTIEEKISEYIALASSTNQVTGVKLAEILTEMNDVLSVVNLNNQQLVADNNSLTLNLNSLINDFSALQAQVNSHIGNTGVHLIAGDRARLSSVGATYYMTEGLVENGLSFSQQTFTANALKGFNSNGVITDPFDFKSRIIASINNTFKIEIWANGRVPLIVNLRLNKAIQLTSPHSFDGYYVFDFPTESMPTTQEEAIQRTVGMKILFSHVYGNLA